MQTVHETPIGFSAASILAKLYRDRVIVKMESIYPDYEFA